MYGIPRPGLGRKKSAKRSVLFICYSAIAERKKDRPFGCELGVWGSGLVGGGGGWGWWCGKVAAVGCFLGHITLLSKHKHIIKISIKGGICNA